MKASELRELNTLKYKVFHVDGKLSIVEVKRFNELQNKYVNALAYYLQNKSLPDGITAQSENVYTMHKTNKKIVKLCLS